MAKPTSHIALNDLGFDLINHYTSDGGGRSGPITAMHYATYRVNPWSSVPTVHHVIINENQKNPGKYNVSYHVTHARQPLAEGDFDFARNHEDNALHGSRDPLKDVIDHHKRVVEQLGRVRTPELSEHLEGQLSGMKADLARNVHPMHYLNSTASSGRSERDRELMDQADEEMKP